MADDQYFRPKSQAVQAVLGNFEKLLGTGFGKREVGKCSMCPREFDPETEFKDPASKREYRITGTCQKCQDRLFAPPPEEEE